MSHRDIVRSRSEIAAIQQVVASAFNLSTEQLTQDTTARSVVLPRQIGMYLAKQLTDASLPEIGRSFGKHPTTVMHSICKIEDQRRNTPAVDEMINKLLETLKQG